jgi:hypothetical protein
MFLFLKKIGWWFQYCKWIFNITHLVSLVEVLECIAHKIGGYHSINEFVAKAKAVIEHGEHVSKHILQELESLLQDISNHQTIRQFLGNREPIIGGGGGLCEAWTSAKMHAFLQCFASWNGGKIYRFQFRESDSLIDITSGDMQIHGRNVGPIHRAQIHQIWANNGRLVTSPTALNDARMDALTKRGERRSSLASSSSSVPPTPRQTPRPLNVSATPVATPRTELTDESVKINYLIRTPRLPTPRNNEPKDYSWLLEKLWSDEFLTYLRDCYNLSKMQRMGHLWVFYDLLNWYRSQARYEHTIFFNHVLQQTFFDSMRSNKIVEDALRVFLSSPLNDSSLWNLRDAHLSKQQDFFEVLRMVIRHELWQIQTQSLSNPGIFVYKCSKGAWVQHPETLDFVLVPLDVLPQQLTQIVEAA